MIALQVARKDRAAIDDAGRIAVEKVLQKHNVAFKRSFVDTGRVMVLFDDVNTQLRARDAVNDDLAATHVSALMRASRAPAMFRTIGLRPMSLGLDLRGGLSLLYQVDVNGAVDQLLDSYEQDFRRALTAKNINFSDASRVAAEDQTSRAVRVSFPPAPTCRPRARLWRRSSPT